MYGWGRGVTKTELRKMATNFLSLRLLWLLHVWTSAQKESWYSLFASGARILIAAPAVCEFKQDA